MAIKSGQFSFRATPGVQDEITEFKEFHEEQTGEKLTTDKAIFEAVLSVARSKYEPYKDNSKKTAIYQEKNKALEDDLSNLKIELTKYKNLATEKENLYLSSKEKNNLLIENNNDVIVKLSDINPISLQLIKRYLKTNGLIKEYQKANKNDIFNNYFDDITIGEENTKIRKLLLTSFLNSAMGKCLPRIVANNRIKRKINERINKNEL